ncbi:sugar O-acetyltransferase [Bisgaard Taxon 10/6]|uniref:sugar O-acetyltransferase n=1 Tax=Exercitatus varius TaxID=67857 RepID=UPI00294B8A15|nr:sugar O-acetyltransferase [Exercitatus varius]MDG2916817.1 sugar O-acetyltransferase [Exercitatus varius]
MSEKDRMLAGELFNPFETELAKAKFQAQALLHEINHLHPAETQKKTSLFQQLLQTHLDDFTIELPFRCDYGFNIAIGKNFYANFNCTILDGAAVTIGNHVMFGPNVSLFATTHPVEPNYRRRGVFALPINIGDNVWIGGNSVVMPNMNIGNNVVIGAGSVVTRDIPDNCIAVGNPCRVLRKLNERDKVYYFKERQFSEEFYSMINEFLSAETIGAAK